MQRMHAEQVQPTLWEGVLDKPVSTNIVQYLRKWYVYHTDNAQAAAVEAKNLNRLSGFSLSKEDFQCWQMGGGEKKEWGRAFRVNTHMYTDTCIYTMDLF